MTSRSAHERVVRIVVVAPVRHPVVDIESVRTVDEDIVFIVVVRTASHQHGMQSRLVEDVADYGHVAGAVVVVEPGLHGVWRSGGVHNCT